MDVPSSEIPFVQGVTESNCYYNISLAFSNVTYSMRLDNVLIDPNTQENFTPIFYVNGTVVNTCPLCVVEQGDSIQVNLAVPCSECVSKSSLYLCVMGDHFGCGGTVVLP
jgi:hypothetical protein